MNWLGLGFLFFVLSLSLRGKPGRQSNIRQANRLLHKSFFGKKKLFIGSYRMLQRIDATMQVTFRPGMARLSAETGKDWALSTYTSGEISLTVYMKILKFQSPHMYLDFLANNRRWRNDMPEILGNANLVQYEGFMKSRFNFFAPKGYLIDALVIGAPDVLDSIYRNHCGADIEILGNQLYLITPEVIEDQNQLQLMSKGADEIAKALNDNLSRYKDSRRISFGQPIGYEGRRLNDK